MEFSKVVLHRVVHRGAFQGDVTRHGAFQGGVL